MAGRVLIIYPALILASWQDLTELAQIPWTVNRLQKLVLYGTLVLLRHSYHAVRESTTSFLYEFMG